MINRREFKLGEHEVSLMLGKFAPLHKGHEVFIEKAIKKSLELKPDNIIVIAVCHDEKLIEQQHPFVQSYLEAPKRFRAVTQYVYSLYPKLMHNGQIRITFVDESDIQGYPQGQVEFTHLLLEGLRYSADRLNKYFALDFTLAFSSEPDYEDYFVDNFPNIKHIVIDADRSEFNISATQIRKNTFKYFNMISDFAKQDVIFRVVLVGVESTGKSTLTKQLVNYFSETDVFKDLVGTVNEVGCDTCMRDYNGVELQMFGKGYTEAMLEHKLEELKFYGKSSLLISDTNNLITKFSAENFENNTGIKSLGHYQCSLISCEMDLSLLEQYELVLYLSAHTNEWVANYFRFGSDKFARLCADNKLQRMVKETGSSVNYIAEGIDTRFKVAVNQVVDALVKIDDSLESLRIE